MNNDFINQVLASMDECDSHFGDHAGFLPLCSYDTKFHSPWMLGGSTRKSGNIITADFSDSDPLDPEPTFGFAA
jgi:hypothetical protein